MAAFPSGPGEQAFWRQIGKFLEYRVKQGTVDMEGGFGALLRGWLERGNANREQKPKPAGLKAPATSTEPAINDIAPASDLGISETKSSACTTLRSLLKASAA